ncbi:DNA methylase [Dyadobacter frigoris]|uniref:helicase-related protein n=1 Tax=Dyadobacter frigoris TaxID=2576211 RepID=UPI0024A0BA53|nr:helicase-related protein [Dyadobacter frigoris]GLU56476.1 DNA methylase [Dyadobacter frigoris]
MNKFDVLTNNIAALSTAFQLSKEGRKANADEKVILSGYSGFGAISEILLDPSIEQLWTGKRHRIRPYVQEVHDLIDQYRPNEKKKYVDSVKNSVLTSFYTPEPVVDAISNALKENKINVKSILDPSAGNGLFVDRIRKSHSPSDVVMYEKDLLTGLVLSVKSNDRTRVEGFENIGGRYQNHFDLVTSNIPFGAISVYDPAFQRKGPVEARAVNQIHNYFFLKALEQAKPGGLVAFITTSNFADSGSNRDFRNSLLEQGKLVSAVRLPHNLFESAGTQAGSDIIIVQKRGKPAKLFSKSEKSFLETTSYASRLEDLTNGNDIISNDYFDNNPQNIIHTSKVVDTNQYGKPAFIYKHEGGIEAIGKSLETILTNDIQLNFDKEAYNKVVNVSRKNTVASGQLDLFAAIQEPIQPKAQPVVFTGKLFEHIGDESIVKQGERVGKVIRDNDGNFAVEELPLSAKQGEQWKSLIDIRDAYFALTSSERDNQIEDKESRHKLNESYDSFNALFGPLKHKSNMDTVLLDPAGRELLSLEKFDEEKQEFVKTDIFFEPVHIASAKIDVFTPNESLAASLNLYGRVDLEYMSSVTGQDPVVLTNELSDKVFYSPVEQEYQVKDVLGSGNILQKIEDIRNLENQSDPEIQRSLKFLESVKPEPVPFELLEFNLGERWINPELYSRFATEFFSADVDVKYSPAIDDYAIKSYGYNSKISTEYAVQTDRRTYSGIDLFRYALLDNVPDITKTVEGPDGKDVKVRDSENVRLASQKIDLIRNGFSDWIQNLPEKDKQGVETTYNNLFNAETKPKYDGSHMTFPGLNLKNVGVEKLYDSQKDTSWMLLQNAGGIVDHEVGTGKTLTMIVTAYEMKRLGLVAKPMLIGLKANVGAIADTFKAVYPDAKVLSPTESDFAKPNREKLFSSIANENWDAIILTHDQFSKIPQSLNVQRRILDKEVDNLEKDLKELEKSGLSVGTSLMKGLEKRKVSLSNNLNEVVTQIKDKKDNVIDFEKMGIDSLMVDESHKFKNLLFTTRHDRVAGLGNPVGSQRALNMLFAVRTIQEKRGNDSGVTFFSGTPISNSLTELYLLFKYLRPKELERRKIENFDSWLSVFAKKTTDYEFSVTNQLIEKSRFKNFIKVPELALMYGQITDYRTAEMVGVDRPKAAHKLVNMKPTAEQSAFTEKLIEFAQTGNGILLGRNPLTKSEETAKMLIATNYSKKAALDMRLINPSLPDDPNSKVSVSADIIAKHYKESNSFKGTQMVFCDLGTPSGSSSFNVYDALKNKLINDHGIPEKQIRFIHDANNDKQRQQIIKETNDGSVRVLIGSTEKLGTGVNAQKRVVALHHLDVPWKPSDLEQRVGRGSRAGNEVAKNHFGNEVQNYVYAVEKTLDNFMFNLVQNKSLFISQIKNQNINVRRIDEGSADESNGMNYAEYVALLSGNKDLLEKTKVEKQITGLEAEKKIFSKDISYQRAVYLQMGNSLEKTEENINKVKADQKLVVQYDKDGKIVPLVKANDLEDLGQLMLRAEMNKKPGSKLISHIKGFDLTLDTSQSSIIDSDVSTQKVSHRWELRSPNDIGYKHNSGYLQSDKVKTAGEWINKSVSPDVFEKLIKGLEDRKADYIKDMGMTKDVLSKTWPKEEKLKELKENLSIIEKRLNETLNPDKDKNKSQGVESNNTEKGKSEISNQKLNVEKADIVPESSRVFLRRGI